MSHQIFDFTIETSVSPDRVLAAVTDFTSERPRLWPTSSRRRYRVHAAGETWCDCTEGTGPVWERSRWDWPLPGVVTGVVRASNAHVPPGSEEMRVTPRDGGGSHIAVHKERTFVGPLGQALQVMIGLGGGGRFFRRSYRRTIDRLESEPAPVAAPA